MSYGLVDEYQAQRALIRRLRRNLALLYGFSLAALLAAAYLGYVRGCS